MTHQIMYKQQREALEFCLSRAGVHKGTMLAMEMGTGKSRVAVEFAAASAMEAHTLVILAGPKAVVDDGWPGQWDRWFYDAMSDDKGRWGKDFPELIYCAPQGATAGKRAANFSTSVAAWAKSIRLEGRGEKGVRAARCLVVPSCWESWRTMPMRRLAARIIATDLWRVLFIADESHRGKAPRNRTDHSTTASFMRWVAAGSWHTLCLTGTPMPHGADDLWSQFQCVEPNAFGDSYYAFKSSYFRLREIPLAPGAKYKNAQVIAGWSSQTAERLFREKFEANSYRCLLSDVAELPGRVHINVPVTLTAAERRAYTAMERAYRAEVQGGEITASNILSAAIKLSQMTGGMVIGDDGEAVHVDGAVSSKLRAALDIIDGTQSRVVVFARFLADIDALRAALGERQCFELSGREKEIAEWRESENGVLLAQEAAGGVGVDLTASHVCVFFSVNYSLGDFEQAVARTYRVGQEHKCLYYHLIAKDTIDETIRSVIEKKGNVVDALMSRMRARSS